MAYGNTPEEKALTQADEMLRELRRLLWRGELEEAAEALPKLQEEIERAKAMLNLGMKIREEKAKKAEQETDDPKAKLPFLFVR